MIIDFHTHAFPAEFRDRREELHSRDLTLSTLYSDPAARMASAEELVATMAGAGIDLSVVQGIGWNDIGLAREANDYIIESVRRFPMHLKGFCSVNPAWGSAAAAEVERCAKAGLVGIGELHPDTQGFDLGDRSVMAPLVEAATSLGLPILTHASEPVGHLYAGKGRTTPDVLCRFVDNFPAATIICAHWGGGLPFYALMPEVREALANAYFDSAAARFLYAAYVFSVASRAAGAERILLGSDYPLLRAGRVIAQARDTLDARDAQAVLGGNAARLLGLADG